jgi:membrane-anchored mycosin MYCP
VTRIRAAAGVRAGAAAVLAAGVVLGSAAMGAAVGARAARTWAGGGLDGTAASSARPGLTDSQCAGYSGAVSPARPWAQAELRPSAAWPLTQGAGQTVAVLDSGVSASAPALAGAVLPGLDVGTRRQPADTDCGGHGTFVAGIIAARPRPGSGFAGVAPGARILPVNVLNPNQLGAQSPVPSADVAAGINYAVGHGATVIDVSTSVMPLPSPALQAAVTNALARNVVVIAAVDVSEQDQANEVSYPAAYPGVVAVAAVNAAGAPLAAGTAGVRVDLAAPGSAITSIGPAGPGELTASGAALATGFVAGTAALVRSYYPGLSAAQVVQRLELTAGGLGTSVPSLPTGYGTVSPYNAVTSVLPQESGGRAPAVSRGTALRLPPRPHPATWPRTAAAISCAAVAVAVVIAVAGVRIVRGGRRRGWRPPPSRDYARPAGG